MPGGLRPSTGARADGWEDRRDSLAIQDLSQVGLEEMLRLGFTQPTQEQLVHFELHNRLKRHLVGEAETQCSGIRLGVNKKSNLIKLYPHIQLINNTTP